MLATFRPLPMRRRRWRSARSLWWWWRWLAIADDTEPSARRSLAEAPQAEHREGAAVSPQRPVASRCANRRNVRRERASASAPSRWRLCASTSQRTVTQTLSSLMTYAGDEDREHPRRPPPLAARRGAPSPAACRPPRQGRLRTARAWRGRASTASVRTIFAAHSARSCYQPASISRRSQTRQGTARRHGEADPRRALRTRRDQRRRVPRPARAAPALGVRSNRIRCRRLALARGDAGIGPRRNRRALTPPEPAPGRRARLERRL